MSIVASHYDAISQHYDDWFSSTWPEPAIRNGSALHKLIEDLGLPAKARILDLTCGIGTQSYGLALHGHVVTGVDISPQQVIEAQARSEQARVDQHLELSYLCGDSAHIGQLVTDKAPFDVIISFGNSLPLLGSEEALSSCLAQCYELLTPGGRLIVSMRDYGPLRVTKPYICGSGSLYRPERKGIWVETAEWLPDGRSYLSHVLFIITTPTKQEIHYPFPRVLALDRTEFLNLMIESGFDNVYFQTQESNPTFSFPLFIATKR